MARLQERLLQVAANSDQNQKIELYKAVASEINAAPSLKDLKTLVDHSKPAVLRQLMGLAQSLVAGLAHPFMPA